jgi:hypothetical protein
LLRSQWPPTQALALPIPRPGRGLAGGLGVAADFDIGGKRVVDAEIVSGVRVKDSSSNVGVSFVLEAHYFFKDWQFGYTGGKCALLPPLNLNCNNVATGPFVAVEIGGGTSATTNAGPITGYALGWMVGLPHPSASATSSWNFGVGFRVDPQAKVLGDGFVAKPAAPGGGNCRSHEDRAALRRDAALVVQFLGRKARIQTKPRRHRRAFFDAHSTEAA